MRFFPSCLFFGCLSLVPGLPADQLKTWTDLQGREIRATIHSVDGDAITIVREDGVRFTVPLATFSDEDREYVQQWLIRNPQDLGLVQWPKRVQVPPPKVETVQEEGSENIYRTEHFEFRSDAQLSRILVAEFGQIFEATLAAVQALPLDLNIEASAEGYFVARLFTTVDAYRDAGGTRGSGGVYNRQTQEILVPLEHLGVRRSSSGFTFDRHTDNGTLIHEITHQVMHPWLPKMPVWLIEGSAEYMETIPYQRGVFDFQRQDLRRYLERTLMRGTGTFAMVPVEELLGLTRGSWREHFAGSADEIRRNYGSALLLTYYFLHLDGDRDAIRIRRYLQALGAGMPEEDARSHLLDGRTPAELERQVIQSIKRQRISVTRS